MKPNRRQVYRSREPNTNPRTGEALVAWESVQVLDPAIPPLAHYFALVEVVNAEGPRYQQIRVRARAGLQQTDELGELAKQQAKLFGLVPTGNVELG